MGRPSMAVTATEEAVSEGAVAAKEAAGTGAAAAVGVAKVDWEEGAVCSHGSRAPPAPRS